MVFRQGRLLILLNISQRQQYYTNIRICTQSREIGFLNEFSWLFSFTPGFYDVDTRAIFPYFRGLLFILTNVAGTVQLV